MSGVRRLVGAGPAAPRYRRSPTPVGAVAIGRIPLQPTIPACVGRS
jgi:hypothetical protein